MKPISIYALTRIQDPVSIQKLERQMSRRFHPLKIKKWEIDGLNMLVDHLLAVGADVALLDFFYSYQIPKLGKEYDLLRISDDKIINIELKSEAVSDEKIKKQLIQNRYYLNMLGKNVRSYTYISKINRLVRLTNSEHLIEADWTELKADLESQQNLYEQNIENLIKEEDYIISPFVETDRFLNREYFLTSQQKDIAYRILKYIEEHDFSIQGFTGSPGTGKTLLLYDLALTLSQKQKVAIFHCGSFPEGLGRLDERLKRIDFFDGARELPFPDLEEYAVILVDEAHLAYGSTVQEICSYAQRQKIPVIFSYDCEDVISPEEKNRDGIRMVKAMDAFVSYRLTNRIRTNAELSSFIHCLLHYDRAGHRKDYPHVNIVYAGNAEEQDRLLQSFLKRAYVYIGDQVVSKEFDKVVMLLDQDFYYLDDYLRAHSGKDKERVSHVFHGLSRSKESLAIIVVENPPVFEKLLAIVQGYKE